MIAIDLSKRNPFDSGLKAIQQINFTTNLYQEGNMTMFFIIEEAKETILDFSQGTVENFILLEYNINIKWLSIKLKYV